MITHNDQLDLFRLISMNINEDVECYAFGGTAMMFYGYKDETKDIDLLFENEKGRKAFIEAIEKLGFKESSPFNLYNIKKLTLKKGKPVMYKKEDARFDLFSGTVFKTRLSPAMKEDVYATQEFKNKKILKLNVLRKEQIVFMKSVTDRKNDFEDALKIIERDKDFNWGYFVKEAKWQYENGNDWALLDAEKMMQELKEYVFIPEKYFKEIYKARKE